MEKLYNPVYNYVSVYSVITEITHENKLHWCLVPFTLKFLRRKNNLASLITLIGIS